MKRGNLIVITVATLVISTFLIAIVFYKTLPIPGKISVAIAGTLCSSLIGWWLGIRHHGLGIQVSVASALVFGSALCFFVSFLSVRPSVLQALIFFSLPSAGIAAAFLASKVHRGGT